MNRLIIFLMITIVCNNAHSQTKKQWNQEELSDVNVLLYRQITDSTSESGTGTVLKYENRFFLLTAAHISKYMDNNSQVVFRVGNDKPKILYFKDLKQNPNENWKTHPEADISIIELKLPKDTLLSNRFIKLAFPINQINNSKDLVSSSADLTFFGYPIIDLELEHFSPLTFNAYIASGLITQNRGDNGKMSTFFYLNTPSIQGCSGSGVYYSVSKPMFFGGDTTIMIGVMHGTYSDNTGGKLAAVTPTYYLFELLK